MISDKERREVARRLRELEVCEFDGEFIDCGEVENALGLVSDDGAWYEAEGVTRLADLIEPSGHECVPGECPLNVRHDNDRIDQERLLAIATMMAADSVRSAKQGSSVSPVYILHAARNIAEACGETFGSIRNRELAKWGTSIVPKETIVDRDTPQKVAEEMFGKMRHSTKEEADAYDAMLKSKSVEIHPVDRDALLELADDLDRMGDGSMYDPCISDEYGIARRIREALGLGERDAQ